MQKSTSALAFLVLFLLSSFSTPDPIRESKEQWIKDWERGKAYTLEYIAAMPDDAMNYKPTPEMRSFAEQMLHLTSANMGIVAQALSVQPPVNPQELDVEANKNKEQLTVVVTEGYDFVIASLKEMDPASLDNNIQLFGFDLTVDDAIFKAFEHQNHHRGQTTVYLRLSGVTPPQEKLF